MADDDLEEEEEEEEEEEIQEENQQVKAPATRAGATTGTGGGMEFVGARAAGPASSLRARFAL